MSHEISESPGIVGVFVTVFSRIPAAGIMPSIVGMAVYPLGDLVMEIGEAASLTTGPG